MRTTISRASTLRVAILSQGHGLGSYAAILKKCVTERGEVAISVAIVAGVAILMLHAEHGVREPLMQIAA